MHHHGAGRIRHCRDASRDPRRHRGALPAGAAPGDRGRRAVTRFGLRWPRQGTPRPVVNLQASIRIPSCCGAGIWRPGRRAGPRSAICVRAFADFAVVKPQVAFFESYGAAGFAVLERTIAELRAQTDAGVGRRQARRDIRAMSRRMRQPGWARLAAGRGRDSLASGLQFHAAAAGRGRLRGIRRHLNRRCGGAGMPPPTAWRGPVVVDQVGAANRRQDPAQIHRR